MLKNLVIACVMSFTAYPVSFAAEKSPEIVKAMEARDAAKHAVVEAQVSVARAKIAQAQANYELVQLKAKSTKARK